jgi:cytochrome c553
MRNKTLSTIFAALCLGATGAVAELRPFAEQPLTDSTRMGAGFRALEAACFGCHSPDPSADAGVAPTMAAIRQHYVDARTTYAGLRAALSKFVDDPARENARIPDAVDRFGLMPVLGLDASLLDPIAYYIFHTPLEQPDWYTAQFALERRRYQQTAAPTLTSPADYLSHGQQLAMRTKSTLGSQLKGALKTGGPVHAIGFCREQAGDIASDMSVKLGADIRRVSDRPRNPDNAAADAELAYIRSVSAALAAGDKPAPAIRDTGSHMIGYYPIVTNAMCLQCHGAPGQEIAADTLETIRADYPDDLATGYGAGELRGIWVITMEKTHD